MTKLKSKRLLSLLLSLAMVMSMIVTPVYATDTSSGSEASEASSTSAATFSEPVAAEAEAVEEMDEDASSADSQEAVANAGISLVSEDGDDDSSDESSGVSAEVSYVASVCGDSYESLATAVAVANNATEAVTITLLSDVEIDEEQIVFDNSSAAITLELNGKTISRGDSTYYALTVVEAGTTLTVQDSSEVATGGINATFTSSTSTTSYAIWNEGTLNITSGTFTGRRAIYGTAGTLNISGGTISGAYIGVMASGSMDMNISGGTITGSSHSGVYMGSTGTLKITGGTISSKYSVNVLAGTLEIDGESVSIGGTYGVWCQGASVSATIKSGKIAADTGGVMAFSGANVTIGTQDSGSGPEISGGYEAVEISTSATATAPAVVTVYSGTLSGTSYGICIYGKNSSSDYYSQLKVYGGSISTSGYFAITGNGSTGQGYTKIYIYGGEVTSTNGQAIYHPQQDGIMYVYGGTITGDTGIEVRGGTVVIDDDADSTATLTIKATGTPTTSSGNTSGSTTSGAAVAIATYNLSDISVTINSGTLTGASAVYESNPNEIELTKNVTINMNGGTYTGDVEVEDADETTVTVSVTGGTYNTDVSAYTTDTSAAVATATTTNEDGNTSTVYEVVTVTSGAVAVVYSESGEYLGSTTSLTSTAISCLAEGCTVKLVTDVQDKTFALSKDLTVTLDLCGHDIICTDSSSYPYSAIYVTSGNLTVTDSTAATGTVGDSVLSTTKGNGAVFVTGGDVTIEAGYYYSYSSSGQALLISADATSSTVTVKNGTFTSAGYGMQVQAGTLNIEGGTIASSASTINGQSYTPAVKGAVLVRATTNNSTDITPSLNIKGGYFTSVYDGSGMIVYAVDKTTAADVDFTDYISISGGYYDMNNYSVARYLKDGYEVASNSDETTSSTYPYVVRETEVASTSIGYGYAKIDADTGEMTTYVMGTYTDLAGAIYRANKAYTDAGSGDGYYAYVQLGSEVDLSLTSSVGSSTTYPKLIIDLNGAKITSTATVFQVGAGSELILLDSAGTATVTSSVATAGTLRNAGGTLTVYGGTYSNTDTTNTYSPVIYSANVSGGEATTATTTIDGGTFNSKGRAIHVNLGTVTLNGGTYTAKALSYTGTSGSVKYKTENYGAFVTNTDSSTGTTYYTWVVKEAVASIDGTKYGTIAAAIEAAGTSDTTITILASTSEDVVIPEGATITLDLNGCTLTNSSSHTITNYGTLTITGSGTVDNVTHGKAALVNYGTATLLGGTFTRSKEAGSSSTENGGNSYYTIKNYNSLTVGSADSETCTVVVENGGCYSSCVANGYQNASDKSNAQATTGTDVTPTLVIYGGSFSGGITTIKNDDDASLTISGGTFTNESGMTIQNHSTATISGGNFTASTYAVYNCGCDSDSDKGVLTISGGNFSGAYAVADVSTEDTAKIAISGGTFTGTIKVIGLSSGSTAEWEITSGTYNTTVTIDQCADGYYPVSTDDGNYTVAQLKLGASTDSESSTTSVTATSISGYGESVMYVGVSADDIKANYSTSNYPTNPLEFTDDDGEVHGYIFAGWYSAADSDSAMESFPTGDAYAKFVDADVLTTKCVVSTVDGSTRWRFMTSLDTLYYMAVGFTVTNSSGTEVTLSKTSIWKNSLTVTSVNPEIITYATDFSSASTRVATAYFDDASNATSVTYTVTPYWTTGDGTTVTGKTVSFTYTGTAGALTVDGTEAAG